MSKRAALLQQLLRASPSIFCGPRPSVLYLQLRDYLAKAFTHKHAIASYCMPSTGELQPRYNFAGTSTEGGGSSFSACLIFAQNAATSPGSASGNGLQ